MMEEETVRSRYNILTKNTSASSMVTTAMNPEAADTVLGADSDMFRRGSL